ncbi:MAG: hydrogenase maturation nickel metallochaperone HypA [bacterium]
MHELAVCQALMQQVVDIAAEHQAAGVSRIELQVGPLSGVEAALLRQAFPIASAGSVAEGCELVIHDQPIVVKCRTCGQESGATTNQLVCGHCGDWQTDLISGDEMVLQSLELDKTESTVRH